MIEYRRERTRKINTKIHEKKEDFMAKFIIKGGKPLKGAVKIGGAKNAGFKLMIASLLASGESRLLNVSKIGDVEITKKIIKALGVKIDSPGEGTVFVNSDSLKTWKIPKDFGYQSRASIMFAGPLLARFGKAHLPLPGGDQVGKRPVERHLEGLKALGARASFRNGFLQLSCSCLKGSRYRFAKNTHTGTETMIMAATMARGKTLLENVALEPEVNDLISYLNKMGAKIKRLAGRKIKIEGVKRLQGVIHRVMSDRNEAVSYACAALGTKGDIIIENAPQEHLAAFLEKVEEAGGRFEKAGYGVRFWYEKPLKATRVTTKSHPGFMTDWQPLWTTLMTQAKGESEIIETIYEYRFGFTEDLIKMGARIKLFNPQVVNPKKFYNFNLEDDRPENFHAARVYGLARLKGMNLKVADIRAGATLTLAALMAKGKSILSGIEHVDRGYENLDDRLQQLGADIERTV